MTKCDAFVFEGYEWDEATKTLTNRYSLDGREHFADRVIFDFEIAPNYDRAVFDRVARSLWLMSGVSYIKAVLPPKIEVAGAQLDEAEADFFSTTYRLGLGQLVYENGLSLDRVAKFPAEAKEASPGLPYHGTGDAVALGGGKDSLVSTAVLESAGVEFATFSATYSPAAGHALSQMASRVGGSQHLAVRREFDPKLLEWGRQGAYNGHVPVTAVVMLVGLAAAVLSGRRRLVLSNEASAGEGNLEYEGVVINHQYSKSLAYEQAFSDYLHSHVSPELECFSLLRPLGELRIAEAFAATQFDRFHGEFSSCNRSFQHASEGFKWCGECPKCAFVFLALAPFVPKDKLLDEFGSNVLASTALDDTYRQILGLSGHKPFECVGEIDECREAMRLVQKSGNYPEAKRFDVPEGEYDYRELHPDIMPSVYREHLLNLLNSVTLRK